MPASEISRKSAKSATKNFSPISCIITHHALQLPGKCQKIKHISHVTSGARCHTVTLRKTPNSRSQVSKNGRTLATHCCMGPYTPSSKDQWYVFDPVHLYELQLSTSTLSASPNNTSGMNRMISHILANLTATYTNTHVSINMDSSEWVFNNAGGAMGAMW
jgi:hypothetical protein